MPGFMIDGKQEVVPGLDVRNFLDEPKFRLKEKKSFRRRYTRWVHLIVLHTTKGKHPVVVKAGQGPNKKVDEWIAAMWATGDRNAGGHATIDSDASIGCHSDLLTEATYHAGEVNEVSIGVEVYQEPDGSIYQAQIDAVVCFCDWATARFGIQRQMPRLADRGVLRRVASGARDVVGVVGHRHVTTNRGPGDPGDPLFEALAAHGYEAFDLDGDQDLDVWRGRQASVGIPEGAARDGVPGPGTVRALADHGFQHGLWALPQVSRQPVVASVGAVSNVVDPPARACACLCDCAGCLHVRGLCA